MAGSTLCVACAALPVKERSAAVSSQRCAACKADLGVTAYGACFRIPPEKSRRLIVSPTLFTGMSIGAGLFTFVLLLVGIGLWMGEKTARPTRPADPPVPNEWARIPEVALENHFPPNVSPVESRMHLTELIARMRATNAAKQDGFMIAHIERRKELQGLPFVMGDACRIGADRAREFQTSVEAVREGMEQDSGRSRFDRPMDASHSGFWTTYLARTANNGVSTDPGIAALSQILGPERMTLRAGLVKRLTDTKGPAATKTLTRAAVFDPSGEVRSAAIKALKDRPKEESTEILMHGLRYPLGVVAKQAAVAMIMLDRTDLVPQLVDFLGEAAPSDPVETKVGQGKVCTVREVVRINHHRNCLLCHPPSTTGGTEEVPGVMPIPGTPFPESPRDAYGNAQSMGGPMVRADTTYLRQDFSVMMPVENAAPWPEMQRFDFLVRNRVVEGAELQALQQKVRERPANHLSENHRAALEVLRQLTGQDAAPNQAAWNQVVGRK